MTNAIESLNSVVRKAIDLDLPPQNWTTLN